VLVSARSSGEEWVLSVFHCVRLSVNIMDVCIRALMGVSGIDVLILSVCEIMHR
jgi:hypothetical protein